MAQAIDKELHAYIDRLNSDQKKSLLEIIRSFFKNRETPERISIEQYNLEIDNSMKRMDLGDFISHDDVEKESEKW